jgi:hypothetical protein
VVHDHPYGFGIQVYDRNSRSIITGNTVTDSGHSGIVIGGSGGVDTIRVVNNIFAFNGKYGIQHDSSCPKGSRADHNVLYGNALGAAQPGCAGLDYTGGNRTGDPQFRDRPARDLHVIPGSPALDYALTEYSPTSDHDGHSRPQGAGADAGAYEGSGGRRAAWIVLDERLGGRNLVDDDVVVRPLDGVLDLQRLVAGFHGEPIVLTADALVCLERHADALAAAALLAAFAEELHRPVGRPRLRRVTQLRDPLVDLAEERLVARLPGEAFVKPAQAESPPRFASEHLGSFPDEAMTGRAAMIDP